MVNSVARAPEALEIIVRRPKFDFSDVPKHWFGGSAFASMMSNGVQLLFPAGEAFFVRSVRHYIDRYEDQPLRLKEIRAFCMQEHQHSHEHTRQLDVLRNHGFEVDGFLEGFEKFLTTFEPLMAPNVRLSATAAAEHYTAIMASIGLSNPFIDEHAHPVMAQLMKWHAAEELEHKAVAYDVLQDVDPRYHIRILGMVLATGTVFGAWAMATTMLLRQDGTDRKTLKAERETQKEMRGGTVLTGVILPGIRDYLRRDFHPWDEQNLHLVEAWRDAAAA